MHQVCITLQMSKFTTPPYLPFKIVNAITLLQLHSVTTGIAFNRPFKYFLSFRCLFSSTSSLNFLAKLGILGLVRVGLLCSSTHRLWSRQNFQIVALVSPIHSQSDPQKIMLNFKTIFKELLLHEYVIIYFNINFMIFFTTIKNKRK